MSLVPQGYGWIPTAYSASTSSTLNAAGSRVAFTLIPKANRTLSKVLFRVSAVTGTLGANDIVVDVFSDGSSTGKPNASIASRNTVTTTPSGALWVEVTGFTTSVTAGVRYWIVVRNANASPAANNFTMMVMRSVYDLFAGNQLYLMAYTTSTDGGATWATPSAGGGCLRADYTEGDYEGFPLESGLTAVGASEGVYDTREFGAAFETAAGPKTVIVGAVMGWQKTGTPTFAMEFRVRNAARTLLGTSAPEYVERLSATSAGIGMRFASPIELESDTVHSVTLGVNGSSGGSSANYARGIFCTVENSAASKALMPFRGSLRQIHFDGTTWVENDSRIVPIKLMLHVDGEFVVTGGGGGYSRGRVVNR